METSAASEPPNFFIIVIYDLWPTYSVLLFLHDCSFGDGRFDHFTDLLNDLLEDVKPTKRSNAQHLVEY